jgi:hypothetical protein
MAPVLRCQRQRDLSIVIRLGQGVRTFDCLLDAPLVRRIRRGVAAVEEHPRHTARLDQGGDHRDGSSFRSLAAAHVAEAPSPCRSSCAWQPAAAIRR